MNEFKRKVLELMEFRKEVETQGKLLNDLMARYNHMVFDVTGSKKLNWTELVLMLCEDEETLPPAEVSNNE